MAQKAVTPARTRALLSTTVPRIVQWIKTSRLAQFFLLWLAGFLILLSFFFVKFLGNHNYLETFPRELTFPVLLYAVTALVAAGIVALFKKPQLLAGRLASVSVISVLWVGYDDRLMKVLEFMRAWLPFLPEPDRDIAIVSLVFIALIVSLALYLGRQLEKLLQRRPQLEAGNVALGIFVLIGLLFVGQALTVARILPKINEQAAITPKEINNPITPSATDPKPDIYYIVLDRYTNNNVLSQQFNYDNQPFTNFLQASGFRVNQNAYSNYPLTSISISSTLNAQYTKEFVAPFKDERLQSHTLYHNLVQQSSVAKALQRNGYQYHLVGSTYGATNKAPIAQADYMHDYKLTLFGKTKRLRGLENAELTQSPFYRFTKLPAISWWPAELEEVDNVNFVKNQLNKLQELANDPSPGGRFIFAHILVPHDPFNFNADGSISAYKGTDNFGKPIKQKYTDQISFINTQMQQLINDINSKSNGESVILLNADEGAYPNDMNSTVVKDAPGYVEFDSGALKGDMRAWPADWLQMKYGILQAAHIPRATDDDLAQLTSVNAFRIILNRYAGFNLDYLPQCHFAFSEGTHQEFKYSDITAKLEGVDNQYCREQETVPGNNN